MLRFVSWDQADRLAASRSIEVLLQRGHEFVVQTYDYLRQVPETAAILGWEKGVDEQHLEERRRFFTVWLARTLGLDTSDEFAFYLFRAGQYHAGHGPRKIHTPSEYVTGSIGLTLSAFGRYLSEAKLPAEVIAGALSAWNKYLSVQLNQMLLGYRVAKELEKGAVAIECGVFGRLRPLVGAAQVEIHTEDGSKVADVLRKFFNYFPQTRAEALDRVWHSAEKSDSLWLETVPAYVPRSGWRVLLNGLDLNYNGGFVVPIHAQDKIAIFPPGR